MTIDDRPCHVEEKRTPGSRGMFLKVQFNPDCKNVQVFGLVGEIPYIYFYVSYLMIIMTMNA